MSCAAVGSSELPVAAKEGAWPRSLFTSASYAEALILVPDADTASLPLAGFGRPTRPKATRGTVDNRSSRPPLRMTTHRHYPDVPSDPGPRAAKRENRMRQRRKTGNPRIPNGATA